MKRAALYLRVSTDRQVGRAFSEEGYSVETQREACQRRARELEAEVVAEYVDYGDSARVASRPKFQKLLKRIRKERDLDLLIVYNISRFARNTYDDIVLAEPGRVSRRLRIQDLVLGNGDSPEPCHARRRALLTFPWVK